MSLYIDVPRWIWRGQRWAHLISDESTDELHEAARGLGLVWVSFGLDHYDVPESIWPRAASLATVVDSREIVRTLRSCGLRVPGGKPQKHWQLVDELPADLANSEVLDWLATAAELFRGRGGAVEILIRPSETVVLHSCSSRCQPDSRALIDRPITDPDCQIIETVIPSRYSLELVLGNARRLETGYQQLGSEASTKPTLPLR